MQSYLDNYKKDLLSRFLSFPFPECLGSEKTAFNLFVIIAVCVVSIPATEGRKIQQQGVYMITAFFSVFAYVWLVIILLVTSPEIITLPEALITLLLFPLVVLMAFVADKWAADSRFRAKWKGRFGMLSRDATAQRILPNEMLLDVKKPDGTPLEGQELVAMVKSLRRTQTGLGMDEERAVSAVYTQISLQQPKSRAYYRVNATRMITNGKQVDLTKLPPAASGPGSPRAKVAAEPVLMRGPDQPDDGHSVIEFAASSYAVIEAAGSVTVQVVRDGDATAIGREVCVGYSTIDGTAIGGSDFEKTAGKLIFAPGQTTADISVKIFDDDEIEPDEIFFIELTEIVAGTEHAAVGSIQQTRVTIINDDFPGTLCFSNEDMKVRECDQVAKVEVRRVQGCSGHVSMQYRTMDGSALAGKNYYKTEGRLDWGHQDVSPKYIEVAIIDDEVMQGKLHFEVEIFGSEGGAVFDEKTDGSKERSLCRITIEDDDSLKSIAEKAINMMGFSQQHVRLGASSWAAQFKGAFEVGGGGDDEEDGEAPPAKPGPMDYILFVLSLPWKLICALVPPASVGGGWPCFALALIVIGAMTAVIGDLAALLGCAMGIKNEVVAITFVALGTSLPDTFASRSATLGNPTADAAIGNVTGSNAVNVFLGLGISWVLGAFYWAMTGVTDEWLTRYERISLNAIPCLSAEVPCSRASVIGMNVGLAVPAGSLAIGVIVFSVCAIVCIGTLQARRVVFGYELGSGARWPTAVFFVGLWLTYVTVSTIVAYSQSP